MSTLPRELIGHIMSFLPSLKEQHQRRYNDVMDELYGCYDDYDHHYVDDGMVLPTERWPYVLQMSDERHDICEGFEPMMLTNDYVEVRQMMIDALFNRS